LGKILHEIPENSAETKHQIFFVKNEILFEESGNFRQTTSAKINAYFLDFKFKRLAYNNDEDHSRFVPCPT